MKKFKFIALIFTLVFVFNINSLAQPSASAAQLFEQGVAHQRDKNWWLASEKFQEALQKNPVFTESWFHLAQCVYEMDEYEFALTYIDNALKYSGGRPDIMDLKGMTYISLGKLEEAEKVFADVLKKYPNDIDARFGLAELDLFKGRVNGAERLYSDALRRDNGNVKALLSLALISAAERKNESAQKYIDQAMQYHPDDENVYYIAAYLAYHRGNYEEAEKRCLAAIQVNNDFDDGYQLLSLILFAQSRYEDVIDIADYQISKNRENSIPWYVKGLAYEKLGLIEDALATWDSGLECIPEDEIMRSAFENLIVSKIPLEDERRAEWALYHINKAAEYEKKYASQEIRYEYQNALRLEPSNYKARKAFSKMLRNDGFNELYLEQLKFIQENNLLESGIKNIEASGKTVSEDDRKNAFVRLSDTIEAYESILQNTIASKWDVNPFYLDKTRWNIGIYYASAQEPLAHAELSRVASFALSGLFRGILGTAVNTFVKPSDTYGTAYADAHKSSYDYFILLSGDESERDVRFEAIIYNTRTGTEIKRLIIYKTGNNCYSAALLSLRAAILEILPVKAKILTRSGKDILVDIGRTEGIVAGSKFAVIRKGVLKTADAGTGLRYSEKDVLGTVTLTVIGEEISEGTLSDTGFYDRVNPLDDLVLVSVPEPEENHTQAVAGDTAPSSDNQRATENGNGEPKKNALKGADIETLRTPVLINLIRKL